MTTPDPATPLTPDAKGVAIPSQEGLIRKRHADWATAAGTFGDHLLNHPDEECWGDLDRHALLGFLDAARTPAPPDHEPCRAVFDDAAARIEQLEDQVARQAAGPELDAALAAVRAAPPAAPEALAARLREILPHAIALADIDSDEDDWTGSEYVDVIAMDLASALRVAPATDGLPPGVTSADQLTLERVIFALAPRVIDDLPCFCAPLVTKADGTVYAHQPRCSMARAALAVDAARHEG